jgi:hypothetical protein
LIHKPNLVAKVLKPQHTEIVGIVPGSSVNIYFENTFPFSCVQHLVMTTNNKHNNCPGRPITTTDVYKWLGQIVIMMVLGLRNFKYLFSTKTIIIQYPG